MRISIFGLGYVGAVSAGCLAKLGHEVIGVDPIAEKVDSINSGTSPVIESGLQELIQSGVEFKKIRATQDAEDAIRNSELSLVCVGTPSHRDGSLNMEFVARVCSEIGSAIGSKDEFHTVAIRSTVLPGFAGEYGRDQLVSASKKQAGTGFGFGVNPEFLREGSAVEDFFDPPYTLVGADSKRETEVIAGIYDGIDAPIVSLDVNTASMIKYSCNAFHATKVTFANEIGSLCRTLGIDSHRVMEVVCQDTKLNISPAYMKPGFAFGGSCLPKDLRAIIDIARQNAHEVPTLKSILVSNDIQIRRFVDEVIDCRKKKVSLLGLAFKEGTDDLRESPMVTVVESLLGKGCELKIVDKNVSLAKLVGANKRYIEHEIPHISSMLTDDIDSAIASSEIVIVGNRDTRFREALQKHGSHATIFDLVRLFDADAPVGSDYRGIAW